MQPLSTLLRALTLAIALTFGINEASADDRALVQSFYDFLSNPASEEHATKMRTVLADDWESIGDYSGATKSRDTFIAQINGFGVLIPDMNWGVEEMLQDGNRVVVRGRATGTPTGPLFGVDGEGRSFEVMSIDIHTIEGAKIVRTYHVEDWSGAIRQLSAR